VSTKIKAQRKVNDT
jgi:hypothetical protein